MQQRDLPAIRAVEMRQALDEIELLRRRGDEREPAEGLCELRVLEAEDRLEDVDEEKPERVDVDLRHHGLHPRIGCVAGLEDAQLEDVFAHDLRIAQEIVDDEHGRRVVSDAHDLVPKPGVPLELAVQVDHGSV